MLTKREYRDSTGRYQHIEPLSPDDVPGWPEALSFLVVLIVSGGLLYLLVCMLFIL
jgi:hypothetical protein